MYRIWSRRVVLYKTKLESDSWLICAQVECCEHAANEMSSEYAACMWLVDMPSPDLAGNNMRMHNSASSRQVSYLPKESHTLLRQQGSIFRHCQKVRASWYSGIAPGSYSRATGNNLSWETDILRVGFLKAHSGIDMLWSSNLRRHDVWHMGTDVSGEGAASVLREEVVQPIQ